MRLIIVRHGETIENEKGIIQGHLQGRLSKKGIKQAKKIAEKLKHEKIDSIYSSDLARASDTAQEIAKSHHTIPIKFVKELRERNLGEFQGKEKTKIGWNKKREKYHRLDSRPKNGETIREMYKRANKFFHEILLHKHKNDTILLVGHNGINIALICVVLNKPPESIKKMKNLKYGDIKIFEIK